MAKRGRESARSATDLSLFVVLDALFEARTVTAAAKRLGVTQSAVSHALARLREHFGDQLFVRTRSGMTPTERARELREPIRRGLQTLRDAAGRGARFEPKKSVRTFTIATTDQLGFTLLPLLYARIAKAAPGVDLRVVAVVRDVERTLESGDADLVITGASTFVEVPGTFRQKLFEQRLVCLVRKDHPVASRLTMEAFCALDHVLVAPRGGRGSVDRALEQQGLSRRVAVVVPHFMVAPFLVAKSDLVLTVVEDVARAFVDILPLRVLAPPLDLSRAAYAQIWHERSHEDAGHKWLRSLVAECVSERS